MSEHTPDKNSKKNVIVFTLLVSLTCSILVTAAATALRDRQDENAALDKRINLLKAANLVPEGQKPRAGQALQTYDTHILEVFADPMGKITRTPVPGSLPLYLHRNGDEIIGYIVPFTSRGLWGKIQGYLAFENDGQTVSGFSVYSHSETPGLGGEIENAWFGKNFKGKKIRNDHNQFVSIGIARGKVESLPETIQDHYVDGISGATLTGRYLSEGLRDTLATYEPISVIFRQTRGVDADTILQEE